MATIEQLYRYSGNYNTNRHHGNFSDNNPYYQQLQVGKHRKADEDALFELAVKWEAEHQTTLENREYSEQLRDEQREYDSPLAEVQRMREAGINPDIDGASGLGSSSGSSAISNQIQATDAPTDNTSQFYNYYGNANVIDTAFNTAGNLLTSFANFGTSVIGSIDTLSTLPHRSSLLKTQATLADNTMNDVADQVRSSSHSSHLGNVKDGLSIISDLSSMFTEESTDDDISGVLTTLGYTPENIPSATSAIRHMHKNPELRAKFASATKNANEAEAYNEVYTSDVIADILEFERQIDDHSRTYDLNAQVFKNRLQKLLNTDENLQTLAKNELMGNKLTAQSINYAMMQTQRDIDSFVESLSELKNRYNFVKKQRENFYNQWTANGKKLTNAQKAQLQIYDNKLSQMRVLGSAELSDMHSIVSSAINQAYMSTSFLDADGNLSPDLFRSLHIAFMQHSFGGYLNDDATAKDLSNSLFNAIEKAYNAYKTKGVSVAIDLLE